MGTERSDFLRGTPGSDSIYGRGGDDALYGNRGHDRLYGGSGNDAAFGGADRDWMDGGLGNDRLRGGAGSDTVYGGPGDDGISGGPGGDRLIGNAGDDLIDARDETMRAIERRSDCLDEHGEPCPDIPMTVDYAEGDAGDDRILTRDGRVDFVSCGEGSDVVIADRGDHLVFRGQPPSCETVRRGAVGRQGLARLRQPA